MQLTNIDIIEIENLLKDAPGDFDGRHRQLIDQLETLLSEANTNVELATGVIKLMTELDQGDD